MENPERVNPLRSVAYEIIKEKHSEGISDVMKEAIADEIVATMERYINNELLNRLNNEQAEAFVEYMQQDRTEQDAIEFLAKYGVDMRSVVAVAIVSFKENYLG